MAIANGIVNPANSMVVIGLMDKEYCAFASAIHHVTFGLGNVLGVALGGLLMAVAFEYHTGIAGLSPTTENSGAFVAALNTTFLVTAGLSLLAIWTSATKGARKS